MCFMTLALAQILHLGNARSQRPVLDLAGIFANRYAIGAVIVSVALLVTPAYVAPLATLLHITPLGAREWFVVLALSSLTALVGQALKYANRFRH
jgi:Ca2+-transporting ATPase